MCYFYYKSNFYLHTLFFLTFHLVGYSFFLSIIKCKRASNSTANFTISSKRIKYFINILCKHVSDLLFRFTLFYETRLQSPSKNLQKAIQNFQFIYYIEHLFERANSLYNVCISSREQKTFVTFYKRDSHILA